MPYYYYVLLNHSTETIQVVHTEELGDAILGGYIIVARRPNRDEAEQLAAKLDELLFI